MSLSPAPSLPQLPLLWERESRAAVEYASALRRGERFTLTAAPAPAAPRGAYYSTGDYWWPNPDTADGLPYLRRDGESNPEGFFAHRRILRQMRKAVAHLAVAHAATGEARFAGQAAERLETFFLDPSTRMLPHMEYAQAIPGICPGRGIGIIDTLHLVEVPLAIHLLEANAGLSAPLVAGLKGWFADFLEWLCTHPFGEEERAVGNNHSIAYALQVAIFARFTGAAAPFADMQTFFKNALLPDQMALDGSFPLEMERTKPFGYAIFTLDCLAALAHALSTPEENFRAFAREDGRGLKRGLDFLFPYVSGTTDWPYRQDIEHFEAWPARPAFPLLAAVGLNEARYLEAWMALPPTTDNLEVRRNQLMRQPLLWLGGILPSLPSFPLPARSPTQAE